MATHRPAGDIPAGLLFPIPVSSLIVKPVIRCYCSSSVFSLLEVFDALVSVSSFRRNSILLSRGGMPVYDVVVSPNSYLAYTRTTRILRNPCGRAIPPWQSVLLFPRRQSCVWWMWVCGGVVATSGGSPLFEDALGFKPSFPPRLIPRGCFFINTRLLDSKF